MRWPLILAIVLLGFHYPITTPVLLQLGVDMQLANTSIKGGIAGVFVFSILMFGRSGRQTLRVGLPLIIFFLIYGVRLIYDVLFLGILIDRDATYVFGYFFGLTLLPALALLYGLRSEDLPRLHLATFIALIIANLSLFQYVLSNGLEAETAFAGRLEVEGDIVGTAVINPILVGLVGATLVAFALGRVALMPLSVRGQSGHLGLVALGMMNLLMGGSRGPAVAFVFCFLVLLYTLLRGTIGRAKLRARASLLAYASLIVIVLVYLIVTQVVSVYLFERFTMMAEGTLGGGAEERDYIYARAWQDFLDYPLFGSSYVVSFGGWLAHNFALDALMSTGFAGGVFFVLAMFWALRGLVRLIHGSLGPEGYSIAMAAICFITIGTTSGSVGQSPEVWLFITIVTVLGNDTALDWARRRAPTASMPSPATSASRPNLAIDGPDG